jgi:hypothetical protein
MNILSYEVNMGSLRGRPAALRRLDGTTGPWGGSHGSELSIYPGLWRCALRRVPDLSPTHPQ